MQRFLCWGRGWVSSALPGETPEEGFGGGTGTRTSPGASEEDQGFQHLVLSRIGGWVGRKFPFRGQCCELSHRKYGWIFKPWTLSFAVRQFCDLSGVAVYEMGAIVFSSFSSLSPALLPVYFSHYMFVQHLAQWDPVLVQALGELHNTKVVLMREIINLSKKKRILVIFVGIPIMTSSERLNPRWLTEQRKDFTAGLQICCVLGFIFKQQQRSQVLCLLGMRGKKKNFFSATWHSQFLAFSFTSSQGAF